MGNSWGSEKYSCSFANNFLCLCKQCHVLWSFFPLQKGKLCFANKGRQNNVLSLWVLSEESSDIRCCCPLVTSSLESWIRNTLSTSGQIQLTVIACVALKEWEKGGRWIPAADSSSLHPTPYTHSTPPPPPSISLHCGNCLLVFEEYFVTPPTKQNKTQKNRSSKFPSSTFGEYWTLNPLLESHESEETCLSQCFPASFWLRKLHFAEL